jgi:hypothetical protein
MITFSLCYDLRKDDPEATLRIPLDSIDRVYLSVAHRTARNRTALYQQKHRGAEVFTRRRPPELAALNWPIYEHYKLLQELHPELRSKPQDSREKYPPAISFPISDLTANPLRPHYDASIPPERRALQSAVIDQAIYRDGSDARLFYLEDEPIGQVPYTLLFSYEDKGQTHFAIQHQVVVRADGSLPDQVPLAIRKELKWWAACPPALIHGRHDVEQYAFLDYDVRHLFGFPENPAEEQAIKDLYQSFPDWEKWCDAIRMRLRGLTSYAKGYHAILGLAKDELIVVHRINTIHEIAEELAGMDVQEAVLLDSGGSCAIWANWANGNEGGVLASHWNFRPARGAAVFVVLAGKRFRKKG